MNLPNKITIARICIIPFFMVFMLAPIPFPFDGQFICRIVAAVIFLVAAYTDHLDGKIARERNLVTDFGKFLDPLADKMMVLGALLGLVVMASGENYTKEGNLYMRLTALLFFIVLFRELAVTSLRLAASGKNGTVIAANMLGKIKTVTQIAFIMVALLEPVLFGRHLLGSFAPCAFIAQHHILSYILMVATAVITLWSGMDYFKAYLPLIDPRK